MNTHKRADKLLKELTKSTDSGMAAIIDRVNNSPSDREALEYLEAKELVSLSRAWGGAVVSVALSAKGQTFFQDRADRRREKWADRILGFVAGVASTVLAQWLIQILQAYTAR